MPFRGPEKESLLRQVGCIRFLAAERKPEAIKWHVKFFHEFLEVEGRHIATVIRRGWSRHENRAKQKASVFDCSRKAKLVLFPTI